MSKVTRIKATEDIKATIVQAVAGLGGFEKFIQEGDTVLIKPNYNTADPSPASTAIDFLRAVVELTHEAGAARVIVGESSTFTIKNHTISTQKTLEDAGVYELKKMKPAPQIYVFGDHQWVKKDIPLGEHLRSVTVPAILDRVDKIILLPVAKTHFIADFTGSMKLAIGFMSPRERIKFHMGHVGEKIAEMNTIYQPDLVIMDARKCFINGGPAKGETREPGLVLASTSRVDIDIEEVKIIQSFDSNSLAGRDIYELPQIKRARELNI